MKVINNSWDSYLVSFSNCDDGDYMMTIYHPDCESDYFKFSPEDSAMAGAYFMGFAGVTDESD